MKNTRNKLLVWGLSVFFVAAFLSSVADAKALEVVISDDAADRPVVSAPTEPLFSIDNFNPGDCASANLTFLNRSQHNLTLSPESISQILAAPSGLVVRLYDSNHNQITATSSYYQDLNGVYTVYLLAGTESTFEVELCAPTWLDNQYQGLDSQQNAQFSLVQADEGSGSVGGVELGYPSTGLERIKTWLERQVWLLIWLGITAVALGLILTLPIVKRRLNHD
jgi:hypothetical protein